MYTQYLLVNNITHLDSTAKQKQKSERQHQLHGRKKGRKHLVVSSWRVNVKLVIRKKNIYAAQGKFLDDALQGFGFYILFYKVKTRRG